jgi:DNA polymerase-1
LGRPGGKQQDARVAAAPPPAPVETHYETVQTAAALHAWVEKIRQAELVALDTETTSLDPMQARLVGISLAVAPGQACYVPLRHRGPDAPEQLPFDEVMAALRPWLEDAGARKLLHNAKYDAHVFFNEDIHLRGIVEDTMLQAYVLESHRRVNLNELAQRWLGRSGVEYEALCGKGAKQIGFDEVDLTQAAHYASEDADFTLQLHRVLRPQVAQTEGLERIYQLEIQVSEVLTTVERNGVRIDAKVLQAQSHELGLTMQTLEAKAYELAGQPFNLNSPKQLGEILFERMGLPVLSKTAGGAPSTDEDVLTRLARDYPLPQVLLEYRAVSKLKSTYTDKLPRMVNERTGRVHTRYAQAAVITGRLASSEPNLQNIPVRTAEGRRVRAAFVAPGGKIVSADYSQIELRVMAHVSGDANLQGAFARGEDIHRATASEVFGTPLADVSSDQRRAAKAINFGLIYGMGEFGLASNLGITRDAARSYIDRYFTRYPGVAAYMDRIKAKAREQGYVETVFGRRLWFPDLQGKGGKGPRQAGAERAAINAPMQGTAADLIKMAMVAVQRWLEADNMAARLVMQVHDELVLEAPLNEVEALQIQLPALMCQVATLDVPLVAEVGVGDSWEQAH